jgi:hypothetical protein
METKKINNLDRDWFMVQPIDFELKQYTLLGWLKNISKEMRDQRIFPSIEWLNYNIKNLDSIYSKFNEFLKGTGKMDDVKIKEIDEIYDIIDWSLPLMREKLDEIEKLRVYCYDSIKITKCDIKNPRIKSGVVAIFDGGDIPVSICRWGQSILISDVSPVFFVKDDFDFSGIKSKKQFDKLIETLKDNKTNYVESSNPNDLPFYSTFLPLLGDKIYVKNEIALSKS